jgi:membrane associated rhomboid family serine protease
MLILPLHRPLTRQTLPWVTLALIVFNCLVYFAFQLPSLARQEKAVQFAADSGLAQAQWPLFLEFALDKESAQQRDFINQVPTPERWHSGAVAMMQLASTFQAELQRKPPAFESADERDTYLRANAEFQQRWKQASFTEQHAQKLGDFSLWNMFSATFLHGSFDHLFFNMLFLLIVGLLVENAMARPAYLALYLLAGLGGSVASAFWNRDAFGMGLGASGAIAGIMGALPVLWGLQKMRVFYWIGFFFDFIKVPAVILLPLWLGKELYSMWAHPDAGIGFDAHAGGMATGALLAWLAVRLAWHKPEFVQETATPVHAQLANRSKAAPELILTNAATNAAKFVGLSAANSETVDLVDLRTRGMQALGQLDLALAQKLLLELSWRLPKDVDAQIAALRATLFKQNVEAARAPLQRALHCELSQSDYVRLAELMPKCPQEIWPVLAADRWFEAAEAWAMQSDVRCAYPAFQRYWRARESVAIETARLRALVGQMVKLLPDESNARVALLALLS